MFCGETKRRNKEFLWKCVTLYRFPFVSRDPFTLILFSARLVTATGNSPIAYWSTEWVDQNRRSEFSSHSHESRAEKAQYKRVFTKYRTDKPGIILYVSVKHGTPTQYKKDTLLHQLYNYSTPEIIFFFKPLKKSCFCWRWWDVNWIMK